MSATSGKDPVEKEAETLAAKFEAQDFRPGELAKIKKTRRRAPRLGESRAEVYSFRAPPNYKDRIRQRARRDHATESQVIRDALDAYL